MADIKQVQVGEEKYNISGAAIVLEDNNTTTNGVWLAKTSQITSLEDGQMFLYKVVKPNTLSNGSVTLNITNKNNIALGAKYVYAGIGTNATNHSDTDYPLKVNVGDWVLLVYNGTSFNILNSPATQMLGVSKIYHSYNYSDKDTSGNIEFDGNKIKIRSPKYNYNGTFIELTDDNAIRLSSHDGGNAVFNFNDDNTVIETYDGSNNIDFRISGTKIYAPESPLYIESGYGASGTCNFHAEFYRGGTKISLGGSSSYDYTPYLWYNDVGLRLNRPIYISDTDESGENASNLVLHTGAQTLTSAQQSQVKVNLGITEGGGIPYFTCSTSGSTAAKTVASGQAYSLTTGARITVDFGITVNTASNPTLKVGTSDAKMIVLTRQNAPIGSFNANILNGVCDFIYTGTYWQLINNQAFLAGNSSGEYAYINLGYTGITIGTGEFYGTSTNSRGFVKIDADDDTGSLAICDGNGSTNIRIASTKISSRYDLRMEAGTSYSGYPWHSEFWQGGTKICIGGNTSYDYSAYLWYTDRGLCLNRPIYIGDTDTDGQSASNIVITSAGGTMTGDIDYSQSGKHIALNSGSSAAVANYISAGGGYSKNSGKYGVKVVVCDQSDIQSGLGQDLNPNNYPYALSIVGGNSSSDQGHISFVSHKVNSSTFREIADFYDNAGTITFTVNGAINSSGKGTFSNGGDNSVLHARSVSSNGYANIDISNTNASDKWTIGRQGTDGRFYIGYNNGSSWNDAQFQIDTAVGKAYLNGNRIFTDAGGSPNCGDGTVITQPGGANAISLRTPVTSGRDVGILRLSDDNAYICNSSDEGYTFAVWDTDLTQDFRGSNADAASFIVLSNGDGAKIRGKKVMCETSSGRPGVTRLFRRDYDDNYSVQTQWDGTYWVLQGYQNDSFHADCLVGASAKPQGFTNRTTSAGWTTAMNADGYTNMITGWQDSYGGDIAFKDNGNGALSCEIDGYFYQGCDGHGSTRVADLKDLPHLYAHEISLCDMNTYIKATLYTSSADPLNTYSKISTALMDNDYYDMDWQVLPACGFNYNNNHTYTGIYAGPGSVMGYYAGANGADSLSSSLTARDTVKTIF